MKAAQFAKSGGTLEIVERPIPAPPPDWVRIKVQACGVCRSDEFVQAGAWPGIAFPRIPGHEVAGVIDELGANVTVWKKGQRVGVGWYGGHDGTCDLCRRGIFIACRSGMVTGITRDGGYAEYMIAPAQALAAMPEHLTPEDAAPLMCAGVTTFNALRNSRARPGDLVAIQAIGGLGHLGVQFAAKSGYRVVAISRGDDAKDLALKLGAVAYLNSDRVDVAAELQRMGGARVILSTAPSGKAMSSVIDGLDVCGELLVIGAPPDPVEVPAGEIIIPMRTIRGWPSGVAIDSEDTLKFCELTGVRPMIEKYPLSEAATAYERMLSGKARFRVVLTM
jgi:D-arabinose 1-dehydrogenase-like Zn-dependent alcohol dehydrogenase